MLRELNDDDLKYIHTDLVSEFSQLDVKNIDILIEFLKKIYKIDKCLSVFNSDIENVNITAYSAPIRQMFKLKMKKEESHGVNPYGNNGDRYNNLICKSCNDRISSKFCFTCKILDQCNRCYAIYGCSGCGSKKYKNINVSGITDRDLGNNSLLQTNTPSPYCLTNLCRSICGPNHNWIDLFLSGRYFVRMTSETLSKFLSVSLKRDLKAQKKMFNFENQYKPKTRNYLYLLKNFFICKHITLRTPRVRFFNNSFKPRIMCNCKQRIANVVELCNGKYKLNKCEICANALNVTKVDLNICGSSIL